MPNKKKKKRIHQAGMKQSLAYSSTLRMTAACFAETSVSFEGNAWRNPEDRTINSINLFWKYFKGQKPVKFLWFRDLHAVTVNTIMPSIVECSLYTLPKNIL
jgi:hypothetical protein